MGGGHPAPTQPFTLPFEAGLFRNGREITL